MSGAESCVRGSAVMHLPMSSDALAWAWVELRAAIATTTSGEDISANGAEEQGLLYLAGLVCFGLVGLLWRLRRGGRRR